MALGISWALLIPSLKICRLNFAQVDEGRFALGRGARAVWDLMTIAVVPVAKMTAATATTAVFALVHAIIFNAPLMRVRVEVEAVAPLAIATAVIDFASVTGAA